MTVTIRHAIASLENTAQAFGYDARVKVDFSHINDWAPDASSAPYYDYLANEARIALKIPVQ